MLADLLKNTNKWTPSCCDQVYERRFEHFLFISQGDMTVDEATNMLTEQGILQPALFRLQGRLFIKADHTAIPIFDAACFADSVELLFMTYFVFAVQYPHELRLVFGLIEKLLRMPPTIGKSSVLSSIFASL